MTKTQDYPRFWDLLRPHELNFLVKNASISKKQVGTKMGKFLDGITAVNAFDIIIAAF